ncbi:MAG: META domain-containing protein [Dysgonamonadaceae bacterium]|jgi:hypothetical protein|nr:META domain-containing protein [Dysgonamonadaceae bacterium]
MKQIFIFIMYMALSMELYAGDSNSADNATVPSLTGNKWKLLGIVDVKTGELKALKSYTVDGKDCEKCYTVTFKEDGTFTGFSTTNELYGNYLINYSTHDFKISGLGGTKMGELGDGQIYDVILRTVQSFNLVENELKLYYNNKNNYLSFSEQDTTVLPPCELKTAFLGVFATEAIILKKAPAGDFVAPYIVLSSVYEGKIDLIQQLQKTRIIRRICNFPQYALNWDVPEKGLSVILKGKSYIYDGFEPHSADEIHYDLELLTIKKKQP